MPRLTNPQLDKGDALNEARLMFFLDEQHHRVRRELMIISPEECLDRAKQCARLAELPEMDPGTYTHFKERESHYLRLARLLRRREQYIHLLPPL